jgi:CheY-like chemotaxis protein
LDVFLAEDDIDTASAYRMALEDRGHHVLTTDNGERCLEIYNEKLQNIRLNHPSADIQPFDIVILDHRMPQIKGADVAREILAVYPRQRILLVSAYVTALEDSVRQYLEHHVEVLQKPVSKQILIDTIEDKAIYSELEKLGTDTKTVKAANFTHSQLLILLDFLKKQGKK